MSDWGAVTGSPGTAVTLLVDPALMSRGSCDARAGDARCGAACEGDLRSLDTEARDRPVCNRGRADLALCNMAQHGRLMVRFATWCERISLYDDDHGWADVRLITCDWCGDARWCPAECCGRGLCLEHIRHVTDRYSSLRVVCPTYPECIAEEFGSASLLGPDGEEGGQGPGPAPTGPVGLGPVLTGRPDVGWASWASGTSGTP